MGFAVKVEGLGKSYKVAHGDSFSNYRTLRETLADTARWPVRRLRGLAKPNVEEFWALRDVSFEVQPGQLVGIIGRNGAGKSTLLKILSRITRPTSGRVQMRGTVGSLLEVGTGFHPELTGRENIFLSGTILGMSRSDIRKRFDRIVDFSGTERFLDTPVKRYSSGMLVRLAFSVAAHLEPEILLVDEVLAVGDADFQRRCIERMTQLANSGATLLFVSHNMDLISKLCKDAVLLESGQIKQTGTAADVTQTYWSNLVHPSDTSLEGRERSGNGYARFERLTILDSGGQPATWLNSGHDLRCVMDVSTSRELRDVSLAVVISSVQGARLITSWTEEVSYRVNLDRGTRRFECRFKNVPFRPGRQIVLELWMSNHDLIDHVQTARVLDVIESEPTGFSTRADQGAMLCPYKWSELS